MNQFSNKRNLTGFTLLEIVIAMFVVTIGMGGVFTVIQKSFSAISLSASRLVAANLAQEGIEVVRNIRDTNWLEEQDWDSGLGAGDYQVQYDDAETGIVFCALPCAYDDMGFLNIDEDGFYSYKDSGAYITTKFKRKVTISDKTADSMKITAEIIWKERGGIEYNYIAHNLLYDWK
jgi:type II secretory pathway pseudopilin PulG